MALHVKELGGMGHREESQPRGVGLMEVGGGGEERDVSQRDSDFVKRELCTEGHI